MLVHELLQRAKHVPKVHPHRVTAMERSCRSNCSRDHGHLADRESQGGDRANADLQDQVAVQNSRDLPAGCRVRALQGDMRATGREMHENACRMKGAHRGHEPFLSIGVGRVHTTDTSNIMQKT